MSIQSMSLALRLVKYAAGNTYDQNPVVLVDASALHEAEKLDVACAKRMGKGLQPRTSIYVGQPKAMRESPE